MSTIPELALQEAIFAHVQQDLQVQNMLGAPVRLYDDPPDHPQFPFVTFGRQFSKSKDADSAALIEQEVSLHIWSRYGGKREALSALHVIRDALQSIPVSLEGNHLVGLRVVFADVFRAKDSRVFQAVLRLRALTQSTN